MKIEEDGGIRALAPPPRKIGRRSREGEVGRRTAMKAAMEAKGRRSSDDPPSSLGCSPRAVWIDFEEAYEQSK